MRRPFVPNQRSVETEESKVDLVESREDSGGEMLDLSHLLKFVGSGM